MIIHQSDAGDYECVKAKLKDLYMGKDDTGCIGKSCMAWRWLQNHPPNDGLIHVGYCGLAGVPIAQWRINPKR